MNRLLPLCLLLCGCSDLAGAWVGTCDFSSASATLSGGIDLDVTEGKGSGLAGDLRFEMSDGRSFKGELDGTRADSSVKMSGNILEILEDTGAVDTGGVAASGGDPFTFALDGRVEGEEDVITGTCVFGVPEGTGGLTGELRLER